MNSNLNGSEIAVIGMSCRMPGANSVSEFWSNIINGIESISFFTREELKDAGISEDVLNNPDYVRANGKIEGAENFDAAFFGIGKKEAEIMDPQHRIFLEEAYKALDDAGYANANYRTRVGVFAGCDMNTYLLTNMKYNEEQMHAMGDFLLMLSSDKDYLPSKTSYLLNLDGPSINVQTACSTSLVAIHLGCQSLLSAESEIVIAGGASIRPPMKQGYMYVRDMINSPDGHCRPFDIKAQGIVGGHGVGVVVLKLLTNAIRDRDHIYAVVKGSAVNNDGNNKVGYTAPGVKGQSAVIMEALAIAGIDVSSIGYIETHGTATKMGDAIEIQALNRAFDQFSKTRKPCALGGVKANIGHTSCAAGVAGFIKTVLVVKNGKIPPLVNFSKLNPNISLQNSSFYIPTEAIGWPDEVRRAGVSSFGIGGTNAHIILENYNKPADERPVVPYEIISLSAKTPETLRLVSANLASFIKTNSSASVSDIAFTLHLGREHHRYRLSVVCQSIEELYESLTSSSNIISEHLRETIPPVFFVFPGQGAQYAGMGAQLYHENNLFREYFDRCSGLFREYFKLDIRNLILSSGDDPFSQELILKTAYAQPLIFCLEYALASVLIEYGIKPTAVIGHSLGDFAAAVIAGIITLPDAVMLVGNRGRLMESCATGAMLSVMLSPGELQKVLENFPALSIASVNSSSNCSVSGPVEIITLLDDRLKAHGIPCFRLPVSRAFHNKMMESCIEEFRQITSGIERQAFSIPMVSNVDGEMMPRETNPLTEYWITQMMNPVNFDKGIRQLLKYSSGIFIETGPGKTLTGFIRQNKMRNNDHALITLLTNQTKKSELAHFLEAIGHLWSKGIAIDFAKMYKVTDARRCSLPSYPFEAKPYWIGKGLKQNNGTSHNSEDIFFYTPFWRQSISSPVSEKIKPGKELLLVFLSEESPLENIVNNIQMETCQVTLVRKGAGFLKWSDGSYSVDPEAPDNYESLFKSLSPGQNTDVNIWFDGWNAGTTKEARIEQRLIELSVLTRQLGSLTGYRFKLYVITNSIHRITGEEIIDPSQALLQGFSKIAPLEYVNIQTRVVDIFSGTKSLPSEIGNMMVRELRIRSSQPVVAIRGKQRFVIDYEKMIHAPESGSRLKAKGVYLITGGFKGIAVQIALAIATAQKNVKIVLMGRSDVPDNLQWPAIDKLRELVSELKLIKCDVSDHNQVSNLIQTLRQEWGRIDGVVHAAGLPDYFGIIHHRTRENINEILRPKVQGTLVLDSLLDYNQLDFLVLFSTIGTVFYKAKAGQVAYEAANEFIDAFSDFHKSVGKNKTIVINWNDWKEVGMSVEANTRLAAMLGIDTDHSIFSDAILPIEGQTAFLKLLASGYQNIIVSKRNVIEEFHQYDQFNLAEYVEAIRKPPAYKNNRSHKSGTDSPPSTELQKVLCGIWIECLGIEPIGIHDNFFELGGHSLLAIQMVSKMQERLTSSVIPSLEIIFMNPTIAELSEYIENMEWQNMSKRKTVETGIEEEEGFI